MNPSATAPIGETGVSVTRIGFGAAGIGRDGTTARDANECVAVAWRNGIRTFDVAPMYGSGRAELRLGQALAHYPHDDYVLSTKVGRLVDDPGAEPDGAGTAWHFDFTADAIRRSLDASLERLRLDRVDIVYIHDADQHWQTAIEEAWPVLDDLRRQGIVRAVGAGMTQVPLLERFVRETSMDVILLAGRYSLLDAEAATSLLPLCQQKGTAVVVAQALHGGLIDGVRDPHIHYRPIDVATDARRARIAAVCHRHGIATAAAAIQFPLAHPAVAALLTGPMNADQLTDNLAWARTPVPAGVWRDLRDEGLIDPNLPVPDASDGA